MSPSRTRPHSARTNHQPRIHYPLSIVPYPLPPAAPPARKRDKTIGPAVQNPSGEFWTVEQSIRRLFCALCKNPQSSARRIQRTALENQALSEPARCKTNSFALVIAISNFGAKCNTMPTNLLRRATQKTPMQNPLNPEPKRILHRTPTKPTCKSPIIKFPHPSPLPTLDSTLPIAPTPNPPINSQDTPNAVPVVHYPLSIVHYPLA